MATDPAAVAKSRRGRSKGQLPHVLSLIQLRLLAITCTLSVPFRMTLATSWAMGPTEAHQQRPSWSSSHARVSRGAGISAAEVALDAAVRIESNHIPNRKGGVNLRYGRAGGEMARSLSSLSCSPGPTESAWSCR